jgi:hypothetical protein
MVMLLAGRGPALVWAALSGASIVGWTVIEAHGIVLLAPGPPAILGDDESHEPTLRHRARQPIRDPGRLGSLARASKQVSWAADFSTTRPGRNCRFSY